MSPSKDGGSCLSNWYVRVRCAVLAVLCLLFITLVQCVKRLIGMADLTNRKGLS